MAVSLDKLRVHRWMMAQPVLGIHHATELEGAFTSTGKFHRHPNQIQMLIVLAGDMGMQVDGKPAVELRPYDRCAFLPTCIHRTFTEDPAQIIRYLDIRVVIDPPTPLAAYAQSVATQTPSAGDPAAVDAALDALKALPTKPPLSRSATAFWALMSAFDALPDPPAQAAHEPSDPRIAMAERLMRQYLSQSISVEQIARRVNVSPSYLRHLYVREFGQSPIQRLRRLRINQAADYLVHSLLSIKEIAQACGFPNVSYFSSAFREETGKSPREYRKQARARQD